jgi:hypothetical protein
MAKGRKVRCKPYRVGPFYRKTGEKVSFIARLKRAKPK